jgi:hypothetical protein
VQAIVSVEVTIVMCLLSCKGFGKILLYTDLALDIVVGIILIWNVACGLLEMCEKASVKVCRRTRGRTSIQCWNNLHSGNDTSTLNYWIL